MAKDKSIVEKFTDAMKGIASTATEAASQALKADELGLKAEERAVAYVPLAADSLVSDPLVAPSVAAAPDRRKRAAHHLPACQVVRGSDPSTQLSG